MKDGLLYEKLVHDNRDKFYRIYLTVTEFREKYYLNFRKYFLSYDGEYIPSKEGISMEMELDNTRNLLEGVLDICSSLEAISAAQLLENISNNVEPKDS